MMNKKISKTDLSDRIAKADIASLDNRKQYIFGMALWVLLLTYPLPMESDSDDESESDNK